MASGLDVTTSIDDDPSMSKRWRLGYARGYSWTRKVERAVRRLQHPEQGAFIAIINAIEFQFDVGADAETIHHLVTALIRFTRVAGVEPSAIHLSIDASEAVASFAPRPRRRGR